MTSNVALKRIVAYIIDYFLITLVSSALVYISFINPKYDEYIEVTEKYNEIMQLLKQAKALNIQTLGDLKKILDENGISGNKNIINFINERFVMNEEESTDK